MKEFAAACSRPGQSPPEVVAPIGTSPVSAPEKSTAPLPAPPAKPLAPPPDRQRSSPIPPAPGEIARARAIYRPRLPSRKVQTSPPSGGSMGRSSEKLFRYRLQFVRAAGAVHNFRVGRDLLFGEN